MMRLFEVTNGMTGNGTVRCYVWAGSEVRALEVATARFREYAQERYTWSMGESVSSLWQDLRIKELMSADDEEFCTRVNDDGWEREADTAEPEEHGRGWMGLLPGEQP